MVKCDVTANLNTAHVPRNKSAKQAFKYNSNNSPWVSIHKCKIDVFMNTTVFLRNNILTY